MWMIVLMVVVPPGVYYGSSPERYPTQVECEQKLETLYDTVLLLKKKRKAHFRCVPDRKGVAI